MVSNHQLIADTENQLLVISNAAPAPLTRSRAVARRYDALNAPCPSQTGPANHPHRVLGLFVRGQLDP